MNEVKAKALEMAIRFFSVAPEKTIDNVIKGREHEGKKVHLPDVILEIAEKFEKYID